MSRYPQSIPGQYGGKCPYCGGRKNVSAKTCRACDPSFSSFSKASEWARQHEAGRCVLIHRQYGYQYIEWPLTPESQARYLDSDVVPFAFNKPKRNGVRA